MRCPNCGVTPAPSASPPNPWIGRALAAVILALWFLAFGWYYRGLVSGMRVNNPAGPARRAR